MQSRIERLREMLGGSFEAAVVMTSVNRNYFSNFKSSEGFVVITRDSAYLLVDFRYIEAARQGAEGVSVEMTRDWKSQIAEMLKKSGARRVLVEREISLAQFAALQKAVPDAEFINSDVLSAATRSLRESKSAEEVEKIKAAQAITDAAFADILGFIEPGKTEREVAARLEYAMRERGADGFAFDSIVVAGPNSSRPHGVPGDRPIERGELVTMDFGALKDSYCSDMTRTVAVGEPGRKVRDIYELVLSAHLAAMDVARAGVTGKQLDAAARDVITAAGYGDCFGHGLGHSLGLEIHEDPRANTVWDKPLPLNSIMTIEPGVYLPGEFGVRIENMVLITESGCENLTFSDRELLVL